MPLDAGGTDEPRRRPGPDGDEFDRHREDVAALIVDLQKTTRNHDTRITTNKVRLDERDKQDGDGLIGWFKALWAATGDEGAPVRAKTLRQIGLTLAGAAVLWFLFTEATGCGEWVRSRVDRYLEISEGQAESLEEIADDPEPGFGGAVDSLSIDAESVYLDSPEAERGRGFPDGP